MVNDQPIATRECIAPSMVADLLAHARTPETIHRRWSTPDGDRDGFPPSHAKGGGSENKSKFTVLNPSNSLVD